MSILISILYSGCNTKDSPEIPSPEDNKSGVGVEVGGKTYNETTIEGSYYYGQIVMKSQLTAEAFKGPETQTFLNHISNLFGEEKRNFGLYVTPTLDGKRQPDIILFSYSYDIITKSWITYLNEEPRTSMVLLKPSTILSLELKFTSVDGKTFKKAKDMSNNIIAAPLFLGITSPYIQLLTSSISEMLSSNVSSTINISFEPTSDTKKSVEYIIKTKENKELAKVEFSLLLRESIVSGRVVTSNLNSIPKVNKYSNPLLFAYTDYQSTFTLSDLLEKEESIKILSLNTNAAQFRIKCESIINKLETYGLNVFDRYNSFFQILNNTNFNKDINLYNSGCLSQNRFDLLKEMGIHIEKPST